MAVNRAGVVDQNFIRAVQGMERAERRADVDSLIREGWAVVQNNKGDGQGDGGRGDDSDWWANPVREGWALTARAAMELFESQIESRHLDLTARALKARDQCFYTIGSSGHEGNAAVAAALRPDDPAFLHYRSGAFFQQRAKQVPGMTGSFDVLLGLAASADEPIAGGRHKVFGSLALNIPPQTSTIASHLPKALGMALAIERGKRLGLLPESDDRIVVCTFGDASLNHSTAQGAINAARWHAHQGIDCPLLFVCEDNGIGISVPTPDGWVAATWQEAPGLAYVAGDGLYLPDVADAAEAAARWVRQYRRPCLLHVRTVRLLGHAGSDVESTYRSPEDIAATEARDPLIQTAQLLVSGGWMSPEEVLSLYEEIRARITAAGEEAIRRPRLTDAATVIAPLAPLHPDRVAAEVARPADPAARAALHGNLPERDGPRHLAVQINRALLDLLIKYPEMILFGEDTGKKGGVYNVTNGLQKKMGKDRVFDTLLDEQTILGLGLGAAAAGQLPVPEIQYLAYFHNACDQIRGEACSLQYFSQGQFRNPMVVRVQGFAYQKGFGGHFHNDNSVAALRDIPGLILAAPARPDDAVKMLRTCVAAAKVDGAVCMIVEPIALYMTRDLYAPGDEKWAATYPAPEEHIPVGRARIYDAEGAEAGAADLLIVSWANGLWMSLRVAAELREKGVRCRVMDLRWLNPLPVEDLLAAARGAVRVLVVDECRRTGGMAEAIFAALVDGRYAGSMARVAGADVYIPLGAAANLVLVQEEDIRAAALTLLADQGAGEGT